MTSHLFGSGALPGTHKLLVRGGLIVMGALLVSALGGRAGSAEAEDEAPTPSGEVVLREVRGLTERLEATKGELAVTKVQLERANAVIRYSARYRIPADLSAAIYDIALSEGLDPALAFRLVKVESNFVLTAKSSANAIGYTQIQLATARFYEPGLEERHLYDRDVNLRIGFRFLKDLMRKYDGNLELALLAYNRGPARVEGILASGGDPRNGYSDAVLRGYRVPAGATD